MNHLLIDDEKFWKVLNFLTKLNKKYHLQDTCKKLEATEKQIIKGIYYLNQLDYKIIINKRRAVRMTKSSWIIDFRSALSCCSWFFCSNS